MNSYPLVAAHLLDCNRLTYDPRDENAFALRWATRTATWRSHLSKLTALLRWKSRVADGSPKLVAAIAGR